MKRFFRALLISFGVLLLAIILALSLAYINYTRNRVSAPTQIPADFLVYAQVRSLSELVSNEALNNLLPELGLNTLKQFILQLTSQDCLYCSFLKRALDISSYAYVGVDKQAVIIVDIGIYSEFIRLVSFFSNLLPKNIDLSIVQAENERFYIYDNKGPQLNFSLNKNLLFFSTNLQALQKMLGKKNSADNIDSREEQIQSLSEQLGTKSNVILYLNNVALLGLFDENSKELQILLSDIEFAPLSALAVELDREEIDLKFYSPWRSENNDLLKFFGSRDRVSKILSKMANNLAFYSDFQFSSLQNLVNISTHFLGRDFANTLDKLNKQISFLAGVRLDDVANWLGSEAGLFYQEPYEKPVYFAELSSTKEWSKFTANLEKSLILRKNKEILINNDHTIHQFAASFLASLALPKSLELPYFTVYDKYLLLSFDALPILSFIENAADEKQRLVLSQKSLKKLPKSQFHILYDHQVIQLPLIKSSSILDAVLRYYNLGLLGLALDAEHLELRILARRREKKSTKIVSLASNYPIKLEHRVDSNIYNIGSSSQDILAYRSADKLIYVNRKAELLENFDLGEKGVLSRAKSRVQIRTPAVYFTGNSGDFYRFNQEGLMPGYPLKIGVSTEVEPLHLTRDRLLLLQKSPAKLISLDLKSLELAELAIDLEKELRAPPWFNGELLAFYPKRISGWVHLVEANGTAVAGWPKKIRGTAFNGPLIIGDKVLFLTQAGYLYNWSLGQDEPGRDERDFLRLPGLYYQEPLAVPSMLNPQDLVTISSAGKILIWNVKNEVLTHEQDLARFAEKTTRLSYESFGNKAIFIVYNAGNQIALLDSNLHLVPGSPLIGHWQPILVEPNFILTASLDSKLYLYKVYPERIPRG